MAREAVAAAEEQRLAAVRAAEEAKERVKLAGLPPSPIPEPIAHDPAALTRTLQAELARVGCNPGAVDGRWGTQAKEALAKFARLIEVSLTVDEPTPEALKALKEQRPICSLTCGAGEIENNGRCVAKKVNRKSDHQAERAKKGTQETGKSSGECASLRAVIIPQPPSFLAIIPRPGGKHFEGWQSHCYARRRSRE